jgi:predicted ArsR family transcriptional regulator
MYQNQIAKRMDIDHKTAKYHLDKLLEAEIVYTQKKGRQTMFFPKEIAQKMLDDDLTFQMK